MEKLPKQGGGAHLVTYPDDWCTRTVRTSETRCAFEHLFVGRDAGAELEFDDGSGRHVSGVRQVPIPWRTDEHNDERDMASVRPSECREATLRSPVHVDLSIRCDSLKRGVNHHAALLARRAIFQQFACAMTAKRGAKQ